MAATAADPPIVAHIDRASFSLWSRDEIKKISVKQITEPKSFGKGGAVDPDGLYSLSLGPCKKFEICVTCNLNNFDCPGHYGHIELSVPVFHPMLVQILYQILSKCCLECHHFRMSQTSLKLFLAQMEALNCGFDHLIDELEEISIDMCRNDKSEGDSYIHVVLGKKLAARIKEEKEKTPDFDCQKRPQQRSIVERLSKLFRNFIMGKLIKPLKQCPHCDEKKISMSLHQQSVLVVGINSSRPIEDLMADDEISGKPKKSRTGRKKKVFKHEKSNDLHYLCTEEKRFLTPIGAREHFRKLWKNERRTLERIFHFLKIDYEQDDKDDDRVDAEICDDGDPKEELKRKNKSQPVDLFFIDTILVPPSKFRPPMSQHGREFEGPRTAALGNVMKQSIVVQDLIDQMKSEPDEVEAEMMQQKVQTNWKSLQVAVNSLWDNEMDKYGKNKYTGLKQLIDKKEGLFRKNMMGKRVNFAARSVISPDPNILVDQIGVPVVFAKKLTYPQPVTPWNLKQLKEAVLNGPNNYPGAVSVVYEDGSTVSLAKETTRQNIAARLTYHPRNKGNRLRKDTHMGTIVNRHLITGDVLLFNRQPTLHKPSIMAFRARVLPNEKGFRLHYANCKSFNADFDGDEMNAHLPQSEVARSEAYNLASVNYQYLVPKDGSPLGGLIQDHVVAVCILTRRDQFFDKAQYDQLVYCALSFLDKPLKLEPPTIMRPGQLWTGKQVITTIIKNCIPKGQPPPSFDIKSKIGPKVLNIKPEYEKLSDCHVIIRNGELVVGYMDKSNVGATQYGLVHICYELYGGETSSNLMSAFSRLSTWYLPLYQGFTLGIADILVDDEANKDRWQSIQNSLTVGNESAKEALGITGQVAAEELVEKLREAHSDRDQLPMKKLDAAMKTRTDNFASEISARCLPNGLIRRFPDNNLQMMIQSGAKGGTVNALQISCLLGQIELEGRRVPLSMSGRSLPSFAPYDTSPKAGGFVTGRFLTGIQPQEFFFHCMAGREGLIDTAVKTSRSGYLQRCLIKHLEGLTVHYDQTVRDSCGSVVQFLYGEDGLDICKSQMLKDKAFPVLIDNHRTISPSEEELSKLDKAKESYEDDLIARTEEIQLWLERNGEDRIRNVRGSGFLDFLHSILHQPVSMDLNLPSSDSQMADYADGDANTNQAVTEPVQLTGDRLRKIVKAWYELSFKEKRKWMKRWECCPDPLTNIMNPASHYGVVPELLDKRIEDFVNKNPQLIVDSAALIGQTSIVCDENPELSKSILRHWNEQNGEQQHASAYPDAAVAAAPVANKTGRAGGSWDKPKMTKHEFYNLCYSLYMKMLAEPGEAVGLLAAQSIGEPSTQMTLNTFHFAGRGEMNVTLGIPRLREILMTASVKIRTPSMDLPLLDVIRDEFGNELDEAACEEQAKRVKLALNAVRLSDVLEYVDIREQVVGRPSNLAAQGKSGGAGSARKRTRAELAADKKDGIDSGRSVSYTLKFHLLPSKYYKHEFKSNSSKLMKFIEEVFVSHLVESMVKRQKRLIVADKIFDLSTKTLTKKSFQKTSAAGDADANQLAEGGEDPEEQDLDNYNAKAKQKERANEDDSSSEDDEDAEGDNTTQRIKSRRNQDLDYEEPDDDDLDVGDIEARAGGAEEEAEPEIMAEEQEESTSRNSAAEELANKTASKKANKKRHVKLEEPVEDLEQGEPDELTKGVMEEVAADEDEEDAVGGRNIELASFEDSAGNSRSGFVTPANETIDDEDQYKQSKSRAHERASSAAKRAKLQVDEQSIGKAAADRLAKKSKFDDETIRERINQVKCKPYVVDYCFDTKRERWCELTLLMPLTGARLDMRALLELEAKRTYVHRVGNISRALIVKDVNAKSRGAKCDKMIKTEGVSLLSLVRFNHILNLNAIYSNDIHAIANTYGIVAASKAITREMANVFAVYGIEVDYRHLSLIADYMTYNGSIRGMNRMSMEASASPFQQMSYESTIRYLKWAAILGLYDDIKSPSASLVFGRPTRGGTGQFGLLADPQPQPKAHRIAHKSPEVQQRQWTTRKPNKMSGLSS